MIQCADDELDLVWGVLSRKHLGRTRGEVIHLLVAGLRRKSLLPSRLCNLPNAVYLERHFKNHLRSAKVAVMTVIGYELATMHFPLFVFTCLDISYQKIVFQHEQVL